MDDFADLLFPQLKRQSAEVTDGRYWRIFSFEFNDLHTDRADL